MIKVQNSNLKMQNKIIRVFSGIQPSGILHIGNYFGAVHQWLKLQGKAECFFSIVDLHAITVFQDPKELQKNIFKTLAFYLASGIDPKKSVIFLQSEVKEHAHLCWILGNLVKVSELQRMTQYKEKIQKSKEKPNLGLLSYPVLMASDILLYQADLVPVGEDQRQHLELVREIALRFNKLYGETFKIPKPLIQKESAKIMGLDNPLKKMSKSASSPLNYIALDDSPEMIRFKIQKAVTDSGKEIRKSPQKPAISNLLNIYSLASGLSIKTIEEKYKNKGYAVFKKDLAEILVNFLSPIREGAQKLLQKPAYLKKIFEEGKKKAQEIARETLREVEKKVGLGKN